MSKSIESIVHSRSFYKLRKVRTPLHILTAAQKKKLRESSIGDFFDVAFLRRVGLGRTETSLNQLSRSVRQILLLLGYKTVRDLEVLCNPYLFAELTGVGEASLAFLLDLMTAFGLQFKKMNLKVDFRSERTNGKMLADSLGLPQ